MRFSSNGFWIFSSGDFLEMFLRRFLSGDFPQEEGVRKRVGSISLAGITGPEELELLEEEAHCESEVPINLNSPTNPSDRTLCTLFLGHLVFTKVPNGHCPLNCTHT